ncbi:MAG: phosphatidylglycerophosphatase A [Muribaculaceae bacterium]|nr:phosphatidylglycerophosphatase A [Muribaculaceae bacterium]
MKSRRPIPITDERFPIFPKLIATSFGAGFLPVAPGTWGALVGIILWLPLYIWCPGMPAWIATVGAIVFFAVTGTWASTISEKYWGKDPVAACVDETVGQLISLLPLCGGPHVAPWWLIIVSLALFRFFDIFKPLGIRKMERFPGGWGMMADDILAAIYAACLVEVILLLI